MKKRIFLILLLTLAILPLASCKKNYEQYSDMNLIVHNSALKQKQKEYYVFVYSNNCPYCKSLLPTMIDYAKFADKNKRKPQLYVINLSNKQANGAMSAKSDADYSDFTGTTDYTKIKFAAAPGLMVIKDGKVTKLISSKTESQTATKIKELITSSMS